MHPAIKRAVDILLPHASPSEHEQIAALLHAAALDEQAAAKSRKTRSRNQLKKEAEYVAEIEKYKALYTSVLQRFQAVQAELDTYKYAQKPKSVISELLEHWDD